MTTLPHEADHIRAIKHNGPTGLSTLAWACARCNDYKGSDIATYVPGTDQLVRLFNPRIDAWDDRFSWDGAYLRANTEIAQATIALLRINADHRVILRQALIDDQLFFGKEIAE